MHLTLTPRFKKTVKKLNVKFQEFIKNILTLIEINPKIGTLKKGKLKNIRVYKFNYLKEEYLIAYTENKEIIIILKLDTHENFYDELSKIVN